RAELARFPEFQDPATRERIPDPTAVATFAAAKLVWDEAARPPHADWLDWYRRVLAVRRPGIVPPLTSTATGRPRASPGGRAVGGRWSGGESGDELVLAANLSDRVAAGFPSPPGRIFWSEGPIGENGSFGPWAVRWSVDRPRPRRAGGHG